MRSKNKFGKLALKYHAMLYLYRGETAGKKFLKKISLDNYYLSGIHNAEKMLKP